MTTDPEATRRERDVYRTLLQLMAADDPAVLLERAMQAVLQATQADFVYLRLYLWEKEIHAGTDGAPARAASTISKSVIRDALAQGRAFRVANASTDPRLAERASVQRHKIAALLVAPVGRHGALYLESRQEGHFTAEHEQLAVEFADALAPYAARVVADPLTGAPTTVLDRHRGAPGVSPSTEAARNLVARFAASTLTFCLLGPPGSGKTELARFIHAESPRRGQKMQEINCAAIPAQIFESELFGHVKGAFTGAAGDKAGIIEVAHGSTLFLDEIGDMPADCQAKLLKVIESGVVRRVGDTKTRTVDVRYITATNRELRGANPGFREDLYDRIAEVPVELKPLADRPEDIGPLAAAILARHGGPTPPALTRDGLALLQRARWPGNVRQLATVLRIALAESHGRTVLGSAELEAALEVQGLTVGEARSGPTLDEALLSYERQLIVAALGRNGGNVAATAAELGRGRQYLYERMAKLQIQHRAKGEG